MKLKVENDNLKFDVDNVIRAEAINVYEIEFNFSEEWNELSKEIRYIKGGTVTNGAIIDNKTVIPNLESGDWSIGIVGFKSENGVIIKQLPTNLLYKAITVSAGEYTPNAGATEIKESTFEKYLKDITELSVEIKTYKESIEEYAMQIEKNKQEIAKNKEEMQELYEGVKDTASAIQFADFEVEDDGNLYIHHSEKMKNTLFSIDNDGELEVEIIDG